MRDSLKRQHVVTAVDLVLDSSDIMLNFRNMFVLSTEIKNLAWKLSLQGLKFRVSIDGTNLEPMVVI
jgi:DNA-directed RNA polymerase alpha subunit